MKPKSRNVSGSLSDLHGLSHFSLKRLMAWGDHLKVGQPQLDAQHQAIFAIALEILAVWHQHGDIDKLKALAEKLQKVLEAHFLFEERQLTEIGYTKLTEHMAEHKVMLDELKVLRDRLDQMTPGTMQAQPGYLVLSYILGVTVGHIVHSDKEYGVFARKAANDADMIWPASGRTE